MSRIFISYSHRGTGSKWKAALLDALKVFEQHHLLDVWQDGKIRVSAYWNDDIQQAMNSARLAVVLLTKEALESEYILKTEFPFLKERQQHDKLPVFPVICESCDWRSYDWLSATQSPNESNPLSELSETQIAHVFRQLATAIAGELSLIAFAELPKIDQSLSSNRIYLDKFPLTRGPGLREEKLIGREQELALLDLAYASSFGVPPSGTPGNRVYAGLRTAIVSLVAWGGVGKTMLVQHWLQRLQREGWFGARRVYGWSFYSQGTKEDRQASEDTFLAHALEWFGVQCEPTLSPWDKGRLLADAVARERTLLILDGIEPLQYPPGPMGGQLRAPGVQSLLKHLARKANSEFEDQKSEVGGCLCLVTTREPLTDLADFQRREGSPWGSVLRVDLGNLTDEAGAALLHYAGVDHVGAQKIEVENAAVTDEYLKASREVDGHALTLNLLGHFLERTRNGDIRQRDVVKFQKEKEPFQHAFKMLSAFERWFKSGGDIEKLQLAILRILGLFDRPAQAECLSCLRQTPAITQLTEPLFNAKIRVLGWATGLSPISEEQWNSAIFFLTGCGLVTLSTENMPRQSVPPSIDCHPLIREHFGNRVQTSNPPGWRLAHWRLYEHLCKTTTDKKPSPTLEDLQPLYQAVGHGCQAGLQQDVAKMVFDARIARRKEAYTVRKLGAFSSDLASLACFFEQPWVRLSPELDNGAQAYILAETAFRLRALGRLNEAFKPMRLSGEMDVEMQKWEPAASTYSNLSQLKLTLGEMAGATVDAEQCVIYADLSTVPARRMVSRSIHADTLHQAGRWAEAEMSFREAEQIQQEVRPRYPLLYSVWGFWYCDLLLSAPECVFWQTILIRAGLSLCSDFATAQQRRPSTEIERCCAVSQRAWRTLTWVIPQQWLLEIALDRLTLGRAALYEAILEDGNDALHSMRSLQHDESTIGGTTLPASHELEDWSVSSFAPPTLETARRELDAAVTGLRRAGDVEFIVRSLLVRATLRNLTGEHTGHASARSDLDEAWDIAERGPMRLHMADIHLYRARLFFREKLYPWKEGKNLNGEFVTNRGPQDDLAAAEKLINDCGYHRRDEELADARRAILGKP